MGQATCPEASPASTASSLTQDPRPVSASDGMGIAVRAVLASRQVIPAPAWARGRQTGQLHEGFV